jgi:hypothetical protein
MSITTIHGGRSDPTHGPVCSQCRGPTRLTGIEPHPTLPQTDLRTYQCLMCNGVQASVVPVDDKAES